MKIIPIFSKTHGIKNVFVDDEDYKRLSKFNWYLIKGVNTFYVVSSTYTEIPEYGMFVKRVWMHREALNNPKKGMDVDHKDGNGLNNQKINLRISTRQQNARNRKSAKNSYSKYLGVSLHKRKTHKHQYWTANIRILDKLKWLGQFPYTEQGEIDAAKTYDEYALKFFGEYANLNFKP